MQIALDHLTLDNLAFDSRHRLRLACDGEGYLPQGTATTAVFAAPASSLSVDWLTQWTAPMHWRKHDANPIYGPHKSGSWDTWTNGVSLQPCPDGRTWRMYYAGRDGQGIGFAQASVDDLTQWTEHPNSPVLTPNPDNWEGNRINQPRVVQVTDTHWRMYYTGWGYQGKGTKWALGLAESFDAGLTWQRHGKDPIFPRGPEDSPDGGGACVPSFLRINGLWWMYYTAVQLNSRDPDAQNIHLCLAYSDDGIHWQRHASNPILTDDFTDGAKRSVISRCFVRHEAGVFRMWYSFGKPLYRVAYAESLDGIHWERCEKFPILDASTGADAWDNSIVEYPEVYRIHTPGSRSGRVLPGHEPCVTPEDDSPWLMWFCGNGYGSVGLAYGSSPSRATLALRTGPTPNHDPATWSNWQPLTRGQALQPSHFLQLRATLNADDPSLSPALNGITLDPA